MAYFLDESDKKTFKKLSSIENSKLHANFYNEIFFLSKQKISDTQVFFETYFILNDGIISSIKLDETIIQRKVSGFLSPRRLWTSKRERKSILLHDTCSFIILINTLNS